MGNENGCILTRIVEVYFGPILPSLSSDRNYPPVGLILLGNTGVGKSFLANVLLGENAFEHRCDTASVTHVTRSKRAQFYGRIYEVFDVPGLIEYDQEALDRNKSEIQKAFDQRP